MYMIFSILLQRPSRRYRNRNFLKLLWLEVVGSREEVFMEKPIEPNMGPSLADVLWCTFKSTNAGFSSFHVKKLLP
jgi:hypothetical protein